MGRVEGVNIFPCWLSGAPHLPIGNYNCPIKSRRGWWRELRPVSQPSSWGYLVHWAWGEGHCKALLGEGEGEGDGTFGVGGERVRVISYWRGRGRETAP